MAKHQVNLEFQIKSTDPHRSTSKAVAEIRAVSAEFQAAIAERVSGAKVRIRRGEGIPGLPELQQILLQVDWEAVRKGAEGAISGFLTTEFLNFVKNRIKLLQAKKVSAAPKAAPAKKPAAASKKKPAAAPRKKRK